MRCRIGETTWWATELVAQPGDSIDCEMTADSRGRFALVDRSMVLKARAWKDGLAPSGTRSFALIMHHVDPEGKAKWYWVLYDLPAETRNLPRNVKNVGILGNNSVTEYLLPRK